MVSIIIPAHNEEQYLPKTLGALGNKHEIIVVCNGCTDRTFEIASKYPCKVFNLEDKGVSKARNFGAKHANNDKLIFLDADILVGSDTLEKIENSNLKIGVTKAKADSENIFPNILMFLKTQTHHLGYSTGLIFSTKDRFKAAGEFDETLELGEDGKFLRAAKKLGDFGMVDAYVYNSMRRFEKIGYAKMILFWIKHHFLKQKRYEVIR